MAKERLIAIFIGVIMIMSAAGFAINSAVNQGRSTAPKIEVPTIVTNQLTTDEIVFVLNSGRVIIEFSYADNCTDCQQKLTALEGFSQRMNEFAVLEELKANETSIKIIGAQGKIQDISDLELNETNLLDTFCGIAIAQPQECILRE